MGWPGAELCACVLPRKLRLAGWYAATMSNQVDSADHNMGTQRGGACGANRLLLSHVGPIGCQLPKKEEEEEEEEQRLNKAQT